MTFNENEPYIYYNYDKSKHNVSAEQAKKFYAQSSVFRKKQQRDGRCCCPKDKWMFCDTDCKYCPYSLPGDELSLDYTIEDENGIAVTPMDFIPDPSPLIADTVADKEEMTALFKRLTELMPDAITIGKLRLEGKSDDEIAKIIGTPRKTTAYRIQKAREILKKEFPEKF